MSDGWTPEKSEELRQKINARAWERDRAWIAASKNRTLQQKAENTSRASFCGMRRSPDLPPGEAFWREYASRRLETFQTIEDERDDLPRMRWLVRIVAGGVIALVVLFLVLVSGI